MLTLLPPPVRRLAAWCVVALLVTGVVAVGVWLCITFKAAVTPVLLALLGVALLGPMHRRLVRMGVHRSSPPRSPASAWSRCSAGPGTSSSTP